MPNPRLTASPSRSSWLARRATTFSGPHGASSSSEIGRPIVSRRFGQQDRLGGLELIGGDHDGVDHDARHADALRGQRAALREALDLGDHHAAVVVGRERLIQDAERCALVLARQVAELVGGGGPDDRDVDRDGPHVEPLAAVEIDDLDDVLGRPGVHPPAVPSRVHEGVLADLGEDTGLPDRRRAMQLEQDARRDVVGLDRAVLDERDDLRWGGRRRAARVGAGDDALDLSRAREVIDPVDAVHVAGRDGMEQRQVSASRHRPRTGRRGPRARRPGQPRPLDELTDTVAPAGHQLDRLCGGEDRDDPTHRRGPIGRCHPPRGPRSEMHLDGLELGEGIDAEPAELAPDAALLVATERQLGVTLEEGVDPDRARPDGSAHADGGVEVAGPDTRGQAERRGVRDPSRLFGRVERQDGQDRPEDLLSGDPHRRLDAREDRGVDESSVVGGQSVAAQDEIGALGLADADELHDLVELLFAGDRADLGRWVERIPDGDRAGALDDTLDELVRDGTLHEQAAAAVAALAHVEVHAVDDGIERRVEIGVGKHELGVLAAELEFHLLEVALRRLDDAAADVGRPGEADHVHVGVLGEAGADDTTGSGHDVQDTFREPSLLGHLGEADRRAGGQVGRLHDGRAADGQGERELLADDQQREVPGGDHAHDPHWLAQDQPEHRRPQRVVGVAVRVSAQAGRVLPQVGGRLDLVECLADRLAGLERLDVGEVIRTGSDRLGHTVEDARSFDAGDPWATGRHRKPCGRPRRPGRDPRRHPPDTVRRRRHEPGSSAPTSDRRRRRPIVRR